MGNVPNGALTKQNASHVFPVPVECSNTFVLLNLVELVISCISCIASVCFRIQNQYNEPNKAVCEFT